MQPARSGRSGLAASNQERLGGSTTRDEDLTAGVDVKWGVTPNITADFTVNTDFSCDVAQAVVDLDF